MNEFDFIDRLARATAPAALGDRTDVVLGIGDDAALLRASAGCEVVVCCDTLVAGRHFPLDTDPEDLGWKALAVNLSDLAAMGARPRAALLALALPSVDADWAEAFARGWSALANAHGVALVGGDTTRADTPTITVTAIGEVASGHALTRAGAGVGDALYVGGVLGAAAAGLALWPRRGDAAWAPLHQALLRPAPQLALGLALHGIASAAIDVSDGLLADLGHVLAASDVGGVIERGDLPLSPAAVTALGEAQARDLALSGGDDYVLCFSVPPAREAALMRLDLPGMSPVRIGHITAGTGLQLLDRGKPVPLPARRGWDHFA